MEVLEGRGTLDGCAHFESWLKEMSVSCWHGIPAALVDFRQIFYPAVARTILVYNDKRSRSNETTGLLAKCLENNIKQVHHCSMTLFSLAQQGGCLLQYGELLRHVGSTLSLPAVPADA